MSTAEQPARASSGEQKRRPAYLSQGGRLVPYGDARVHVLANAVKYAAVIYEGVRAYWSDEAEDMFIFRLQEHLVRLEQSAAISRFPLEQTVEQTEQQLLELIRANELREDLHIRILAYVIADDGLIDAVEPIELTLAAMPMGRYPEESAGKEALDIGISHWQRLGDASMPPRVKTAGNYPNSRLALMQAHASGYDDALMLDSRGKISEGPGYNLFLVRDGRVATPAVTHAILEGVTRSTLIELYAALHGLEVAEREIDKTEVMIADEAFFCGSGKEVRPIGSVDGIPLRQPAPGELTRLIRNSYFDVVRRRRPGFEHWLTPVWAA